jgi:hypothetical protein
MAAAPRRSEDHAITSLIGGLAVCCAVPLLLVLGVTSVLGLVVGETLNGNLGALAGRDVAVSLDTRTAGGSVCLGGNQRSPPRRRWRGNACG